MLYRKNMIKHNHKIMRTTNFKFILLTVFFIVLWAYDLPCYAQCWGLQYKYAKNPEEFIFIGSYNECERERDRIIGVPTGVNLSNPFNFTASEMDEFNRLGNELNRKKYETEKQDYTIVRADCDEQVSSPNSNNNSSISSRAKAAGDMAWQTANDNNQWVQSGLGKDKDYGHASDRTSRGNTNAEEQRNYPSVADALNGSNGNNNNNNTNNNQGQNSPTYLPQSPQNNAKPSAADYEKLAKEFNPTSHKFESFAKEKHSEFCKNNGYKESDVDFQNFSKQLNAAIKDYYMP